MCCEPLKLQYKFCEVDNHTRLYKEKKSSKLFFALTISGELLGSDGFSEGSLGTSDSGVESVSDLLSHD